VSLPAQSLPDLDPDVPPAPKREFSSPFAFVGVVVVGALVIIGCVLGTSMSGLFTFSGTGAAAADATPSGGGETARIAGTSFQDGQWLVGGDIQAGTYAVTVPADSNGCTWERNASTNGTASSVLESGGGKAGDKMVVGINPTDKVFQASGCGTWHRTGDVEPTKDASYTDNNGGTSD
jgi:hypothetical protein